MNNIHAKILIPVCTFFEREREIFRKKNRYNFFSGLAVLTSTLFLLKKNELKISNSGADSARS